MDTFKVLRAENSILKSNLVPIGMNKWLQHYNELLTQNRGEFTTSTFQEVPISTSEINDIIIDEVKREIKGRKNGRSAGPVGPGNIPIELL